MKKIEAFKSKHSVTGIDNALPGEVVEWINRIDGETITHVVITTVAGRLRIGQRGTTLILRFSNAADQILSQTEVESRNAASEIAQFFLENAGMPAGTGGG